jgi:translocation and assembly module TamA
MNRLAPAAVAAWATVWAGCAGPRALGTGSPHRSDAADEGKRVHAVRIDGARVFDEGKIVDQLQLRGPRGILVRHYSLFDRLVARLDVRRIVAFYTAHGYFSAGVSGWGVVPLADGSVDVVYQVEEGQPTRIVRVTLYLGGSPLGPATQPAGPATQPADPATQPADPATQPADPATQPAGPESQPAVLPPGVSERELRGLLPLAAGAVFVHEDYLLARDLLRGALVQHGYTYAQVTGEVRVDRDARTADIDLRLEPGTRYRFGTLKVAGTASVPESTIRARVPWHEGDVFDASAPAQLQSRLLRMGLFGEVRLSYEPNPDHPDVLDVTCTVSDGVKHDLRLGGGIRLSGIQQTDRGLALRLDPHLRASYTMARAVDSLSTLALEVRPGYAIFVNQDGENGFTGSASATLSREDLLLPLLRGAVTVAFDADILEAYEATGPRLRLGIDRRFFDDRLRVGLAWQLRAISIAPTNNDPLLAAALNVPSPYRLGAFLQTIAWDRRDSPLAPHTGTFVSVDLAEGGGYAGGAIDYLRFDAQARAYLAPFPRLVLAARARLGGLFPADENVAPITERFFGGGTDMRGFGYRHLSPQAMDSTGNLLPVGGNGLVEGSVEARLLVYRISRDFGVELTAFLDAGDVVPSFADLSLAPDRLHWAVGPGLHLLTPAGPLGVDVGFRLNRRDAPNPDAGSLLAFNVTLGEAF